MDVDLVVSRARLQFIELSRRGVIVMSSFENVSDATTSFRDLQLPEHPIDGGFEYLLSMPQVSLVGSDTIMLRRRVEEQEMRTSKVIAFLKDAFPCHTDSTIKSVFIQQGIPPNITPSAFEQMRHEPRYSALMNILASECHQTSIVSDS